MQFNITQPCDYTVQGPGWARANPFFLALDPGPIGPGHSQLALAQGQLDPGPVGSGQGRARAGPDPFSFFFSFVQPRDTSHTQPS